MSYSLTREEMETHIRWDAAEKVAHIFTADPVSARKLDKMVNKCPEAYKLVKVDEYGGRYYEVPANLISFRTPMSEETRKLHSIAGKEKGFKRKDSMTAQD